MLDAVRAYRALLDPVPKGQATRPDYHHVGTFAHLN